MSTVVEAERGSPVHVPGSAARWTTMNVDEALPGTLTPLTWTLYYPGVERAARAAWCDLGAMEGSDRPIPDEVDRRFFTAVLGHAATNLDMFSRMADRMPGGSAAAIEEQLFGSMPQGVGGSGGWGRYPVVAAKAPLTLRRAMQALEPIAAEVESWWSESVASAPSLGEAAAALVGEARDRFERVLNVHLVLTMACQGLMERVAEMAEGAGLPGLERELMKSPEGTAEFQLVADTRRMADGELDLEGFLARHGYHGPREGLVEAVIWREDPAPLLTLVDSYRQRELGESTEQLLARRGAEQAAAMERLEGALGRVRSIPARALVRFACRGPGWRETGRATILRCVDVGRAAARAAGSALAERGALEDPADVFFLTVEEIRHGPRGEVRGLVAERKAEHERFEAVALPQLWRGGPDPSAHDDAASAAGAASEAGAGAEIRGLGVSAGVGEGTVRVVHDQRTAELDEGDVLVCKATDPGWASLFPLATAVVTDVGAAMSHAAIVCRELGIPCVANTRVGTSRLRDGVRVRVDGDAGVVEILEDEGK